MALIFTTDISEVNILFTGNNNIVRFASDQAKPIVNAQIIGLGINIEIPPSPDQSFYFDLKDYAATHVNTFRFADPVIPDLAVGDIESFTYPANEGTFKGGPVLFRINFTDETFDSEVKELNFLSGVIQLENWKRQMIPTSKNYIVLSPVKTRSNNNVFLKYWSGLPFEFSFLTKKPLEDFVLKNMTTGIEIDMKAKTEITALIVSDGRTDLSLEDFLPMITGFNTLNIFHEGINQGINIFLQKADADCGVYIKWRNHLGRFNYWLLGKNHKRDRGFKYTDELHNDFENIDQTISPSLQFGKESQDILKCIVKNLTEEEKNVFVGLFESPKIFLFTGEQFSRSDEFDWMEVTLQNTSSRIDDSSKYVHTFNVDLKLPSRYNQSL